MAATTAVSFSKVYWFGWVKVHYTIEFFCEVLIVKVLFTLAIYGLNFDLFEFVSTTKIIVLHSDNLYLPFFRYFNLPRIRSNGRY